MIDKYEETFGPVPDRSVFDGEIVVPPHLRNMSATLGNRSSRLLGSLNRSRTFLTLPTNGRNSQMHGSSPDLSRSLPSTPIVAKQRMTLVDSVDSVVLEEEDLRKSPQLRRAAGLEVRRKSAHDVSKVQLRSSGKPSPTVYTTTPSHYRNNSDIPTTLPKRNTNSTNVQLAPSFRVPLKKSVPTTNSSNPMKTFFARKESPLLSSSLHNIHTAPPDNNDQILSPTETDSSPTFSRSKWGNVRNSNSFSNDFNVGSLSTRYTIPRPHLGPIALNGDTLTDQQIILKNLGNEDSAA